jgi:hypothetical protein
MLEEDARSDQQADYDWQQANHSLFAQPSHLSSGERSALLSDPGELPLVDLVFPRACVLADAVTTYNITPQTSLGGVSPYDLIYGNLQGKHAVVSDDLLQTGKDGKLLLHGETEPLTAHRTLRPASDESVASSHGWGPRSDTLAFVAHAPTNSLLSFDIASAYFPPDPSQSLSAMFEYPPDAGPHLNSKTIRRILGARESIFKYGIYLPRNDREADASPEKLRWRSGRQLEWLRLKAVGAFEYDWNKDRLAQEFPHYLVSDIGSLFYIYDYKFTGEHRVRLVFDGSKQSPSTYDDTYSPTVRPESIRLFHVFSVEMGWDIRQYDVPQAFLQSPVDHVIFVHLPRSNVEFPGQILKLRLALYGAKQSAALFFKLLNAFLVTLGFVSSTLDPCFYRREDAILIVHVDDMRCAGTSAALLSIHEALSLRFNITTGDGSRFLGMDTRYDLESGVLTFGMATYIQATMDRFLHFDVTLGHPYRELVGSLLWVVLCVMGPELVRVKDLARRSNKSTV